MNNFKELLVWQKAIFLAESAYRLTANYSFEEKYGLVNQIKRCAISIPSNIAEGAGRNSNLQFINFLQISKGSCYELETQIEISLRLGLIDKNSGMLIIEQIIEIEKMISGLIKKLNN